MTEKREKIFFYIGLCFVFLMGTYEIADSYSIVMSKDELGYIGNAAVMAGKDWTGISADKYYSWGYSLFLVPLFWIFKEGVWIYRSAIILNAIFSIVSYIFIQKIIKELEWDISVFWKNIVAVLLCVYAGGIANVKLAWSEACVACLFWVISYLIIKYVRTERIWYLCMAGVLSVFLYYVHQRMLGVLIAFGIFGIFLLASKKISKKQAGVVICTIVVMAGLFFAGNLLKDYLQSSFYFSDQARGNDYQGIISRLKDSFTIKNLFFELCGQVYYLIVSSGYWVYIGGIVFALTVGGVFLSKENRKVDEMVYFNLWGGLACAGTLGISALFMITPNRVDHLFYGRYTEGIFGFLILLGISGFLKMEKHRKIRIIASGLFVMLFIAFIVNIKYPQVADTYYQTVCAAGLYGYFHILGLGGWRTYVIGILPGLLLLAAVILEKKGVHRGLTVVFLVWNLFSAHIAYEDVVGTYQQNNKNDMEVFERVNKIYQGKKLVYVDEVYDAAGKYQLLNNQKILIEMTMREALEQRTDLVILGKMCAVNNAFLEEYTQVQEMHDSVIWVRNEKITPEWKESFKTQTFKNTGEYYFRYRFYGNWNKEENVYQSEEAGGFFLWGPYMSLEPGAYEAVLEVNVSKLAENETGEFDVHSAAVGQLARIPLTDLKEGKQTVRMRFHLEEAIEDFEIRCVTAPGTEISVESIEWREKKGSN